ncbi:MAG: zinc ribbon domain-containing protein [Bacteroidetes bacterium]|nr:zinc ribbon domain-containing protein [Bacteroidota bacterium]
MSVISSCPNCGADVPWNAAACPECGSDEAAGMAEDTDSYGALPAEYEPAYSAGNGRVDHGAKNTRRWVRYTAAFLVVAIAVPACISLFNSGVAVTGTLLVAALAVGVVIVLLKGGGGTLGRFSGNGAQYETLVRRARGDRARAERLIEYERRRNPSASRAELIRDAIDRLARDR